MSPRRHAHSKSAPPRLFTAATGLSSGTAAKPAGTTAKPSAKATRTLRPRRAAKDKAPRVPETRPARSFTLPPIVTRPETTATEAPVGRPAGSEVGAAKPIGTSEARPAKPTGSPAGTGKPTGKPAPKSTTAKPTSTPAAQPTRSAPGAAAAPPKSPSARPRLRPRRPEGDRRGPKRSKAKPGAKSGVGPAPSKRRTAPTSTRQPSAPEATAPTPSDKAPRTRGLFDPRRNRRRAPLALAALLAVGVLVIGFPLSGLLSQRHQLSAAAAQLNQLQSQNRKLTSQQHQLNSKAAIERLARQDYQLVSPGQTLYDVLPSGRHTSTTTASQSATVGDPGDQPLVAPANAPDMSPEPGQPHELSVGAATPAHGGSGATGSNSASTDRSGSSGIPPGPSSFWSRVTGSLAFWR